METRFWLIRHAIVAENERAQVYGNRDVQLCPDSLVADAPMYRALAARLPRPAIWGCTPLSRTRRTAEEIFAAGYPAQPMLVEPDLMEQNLGRLQGRARTEVPALLTAPAHPFWPISATEVPPGGESVAQMLVRVGRALDRLAAAHQGQDLVIVSHGGVIRCAVGHAMGVGAEPALHLSVQNLSLTRLDRLEQGWRVDFVNALPSFNLTSQETLAKPVESR